MRPPSTGDLGLEPLRHAAIDKVGDDSRSSIEHHQRSVSQPSFIPGLRRSKKRRIRASDHAYAALLAVAIALSICIVGALARALVFYNASAESRVVAKSGLIMTAWPISRSYFLMPTFLLLSAAVISAVFGIFAMVWIYVFSKRVNRVNLGRVPIIGSTVAVIAIFIAALVIFKLKDGTTGLYGWSCDLQGAEHAHEDNEVGLSQVCTSMTVTWYLGIVVGALELIMLGLMIRAMLTGPSEITRIKKMRSFHIGRSGYKGVKEASKGTEEDIVPMIERPASR